MIEKDKKHTEANLIEIHGNSRASKFTVEQVKDELAKLNLERKNCLSWAKAALKKRMLKTAIEVKMKLQGKTVKRFNDIGKSWAQDGSVHNARLLFQVLFGNFEGRCNNGWSVELEQEYMNNNNLEYPPLKETEEEMKGCYERVITHSKGKVVKGINTKADKTHGKAILITRPRQKQDASKKKEWYKRNLGTFFVRDRYKVTNGSGVGASDGNKNQSSIPNS
jgi:hypothetical protein